ncbi:hypothetical protein MASR1M46_08750 [Bacteroidales bacterium]
MVTRYDLDGIHFDDYFYPNNDFSDESSFAKHNRGFKREDKMAWRRENVDLVVKMLRDTIKSVKPFVKFGISPYAVWRNKAEDPRGSDTRSFGYTNYDHLHADILKWMEKGWLDYILPQLYFNIGYPAADFKILAEWWRDNSAGTWVEDWVHTDWTWQKLRHGDLRMRLKSRQRCSGVLPNTRGSAISVQRI